MDTMPRDDLLVALNHALRAVSGQGVLYSQALAAALGVNSTDLECLDVIVLRGPVTAGTLAAETGLTTGAITGVIDRLERRGFAVREPDPSDRRKVLVRARPAALGRIEPLTRPMQMAMASTLSAYDDERLALLLDFLQRAQAAAVVATAQLQAKSP